MAAIVAKTRTTADRVLRIMGGYGTIVDVKDNDKRYRALMAIGKYNKQERERVQEASERIVVSATQPVVIDNERHKLEFKGKRYRILIDPDGVGPDGTFIFYDCNVMYEGTV